MELLVALALLGGLVLCIEVVLNERRPRAVLRGWGRAGGIAALLVIGCTVGSVAVGELLRPPPAVTVGSNNRGSPSEEAFAGMVAACEDQQAVVARVNVYATEQFQNNIDAYLRGTPDDVFTWFSGERMRFYAAQGLATPVSDLWAGFGIHYGDAVRLASTGDDGEQYLVPMLRYPWVVIHRRSLFEEKGYGVPETIDQLVPLARQMQADGIVPFAFGDLEGWPAMGLFDILDMRLNGSRFHHDLLTGRERWTDPRVAAVFRRWAELTPYFQDGAPGRSFQEAVADMLEGRAGMMFMGTFLGELATDAAVHDDLDMFPFPLFGNEWDVERAIDAPLDGYMLSGSPKDVASAKKLLYCLSGGSAQALYLAANPNSVPAVSDPSTFWYTPFQRRIDQVLRDSVATAQFLDRDTRPDFAGPDGMQGFLKDFLRQPSQDLRVFLARIQAFYDGLP